MTTPARWLPMLLWCLILGSVYCNSPPLVTFGPRGGNVFAHENDPIGKELFSISATDRDSQDLTFTAENEETSRLVNISQPTQPSTNKWEVRVTLKAALDRDRNPYLRRLLFKVSDGSYTISGWVRLIIRDVNDNPPVFINLALWTTIPEGTSFINKTVYTVSATDPDDGPGGLAVYSMAAQGQGADEEYNRTFVIPNQYVGTILLAKELDYEARNLYQYQIFAKDLGNPPCPGAQCLCNNVSEPSVVCAGEPATFIVIVEDVQDTPPFFVQLPYIAHVYEDANVGEMFYRVFALDGDRGVPNDIRYSIEDEWRYPFTIDAESGELKVSKSLDADGPVGQSYMIPVKASEVIKPGQTAGEATTAITVVSITVNDINDNRPQFEHSVYYASVLENTPRGVPLTFNTTITVRDRDHDINGQFQLSVEKNGAPYDVFYTIPGAGTHIQSWTNVVVSVSNSSALDYETANNLTFQLRATEVGTRDQERFSTTATVVVTIEDTDTSEQPCYTPNANIHAPKFIEPNQGLVNITAKIVPSITVDEEDAIGTLMLVIRAGDTDSGENARIIFSLEPDLSGFFHYFQVSRNSGRLYNARRLDREEHDMLQIILKAEDQGSPTKLSSVIPFRVYLRDIDDNDPVFPPPATLNLSVGEELQGVRVGFVNVSTDADHDPQNRITCYYLYGGENLTSFSLTKTTGELRLKAKLDRETTPNVSLVVKATADCTLQENHYIANGSNYNYNGSDSSLLQVVVVVGDINDNPPTFAEVDVSALVRRDEEVGTEVVNLVSYTVDADTPDERRNTYRLLCTLVGGCITEPCCPTFSVLHDGRVVTNRRFAANETGHFVLSVMVSDADQYSDTTNVTIRFV